MYLPVYRLYMIGLLLIFFDANTPIISFEQHHPFLLMPISPFLSLSYEKPI
jgi:hypothetical protein